MLEDVDVLMYCTGYLNHFPFLDPAATGVTVEDGRVRELYRHLVAVDCCSLAFVGVARWGPAGGVKVSRNCRA